jgi:hypothetical protein
MLPTSYCFGAKARLFKSVHYLPEQAANGFAISAVRVYTQRPFDLATPWLVKASRCS